MSSQQLAAATKYREEANALFAAGELKKALFKYQLVKMNTQSLLPATAPAAGPTDPNRAMAQGMMGQVKVSDEERDTAKALLIAAANNSAMVQLKMEKYADAASSASEVLAVDPVNTKALFRRGCSLNRRGLYSSAVPDLEAALAVAPEDALIAQELAVAREGAAAEERKLRQRMSKMFAE